VVKTLLDKHRSAAPPPQQPAGKAKQSPESVEGGAATKEKEKPAPPSSGKKAFLVPSAPPDNVQVLVSSSTAILVTWEPIPEIDQNGIITLHEVEFNQSTFNEISNSNLTTTNGSQLIVELEGLEEYIEYSVRVRAFTSVGPGPFSVAVMNRTLEDG